MTSASTALPPVADRIETALREALSPTRLEVVNDSGHHAGHMGDDGTGETHYTVAIESAAFEGLNRVARQRLVNRALAELLAGPVHALAIRARAPGEA
jgi:BolA protein